MPDPSAREHFDGLMRELTAFVSGQPLDTTLEGALNKRYPASCETIDAVLATCQASIAEGWMCDREAGGIRYGRVCKPSDALSGFSVDVVDMHAVKAPHHRHTTGEIDLIMPLTPDTRFGDRGAGWLVYGPRSAARCLPSKAPTMKMAPSNRSTGLPAGRAMWSSASWTGGDTHRTAIRRPR